MRTRLFLVAMLIPGLLAAADLKLVAKIPYESLRDKIPALAPGIDYGERGVELWANLDTDCFKTRQDVIDLFREWLAVWYPGHGFPSVLEMRCQLAGNDKSVGVISETDVHGNAPDNLHIFMASPDGGKVLRRLFDTRPGSSLIMDPFLGFVLENNLAVGVLYCDRSIRDEDGRGCSEFPIANGAKELMFYATVLYQVNGPGEQRFLTITSTYEGECAIKRIGARVATLAKLQTKPLGETDHLVGSKAAKKLEEVRRFSSKFETLVKNEGATKIFDEGYLWRYEKTLTRRVTMERAAAGPIVNK